MVWLCKDQLKRGNVGLKAFIFPCANISPIMNTKRALAEYLQVALLLGTLPTDLTAKVVTKLALDRRGH